MSKGNEKKRDEALVERLMRRVLEGMGSVVDRKLGREADTQSGFTTTKLIERMKHLVDERVRTDEEGRRIAPHLFKLKVEWGTHSEAPPEFIKELESEVHAAAIDYINDRRLRTLAPVKVETSTDIFTSGIAVEPTYGEYAVSRVLLALTQKGVAREEAYAMVQRNAMRAWQDGGDFLALLKADPDVRKHLSEAELTENFDLGYHLKHVDTIFARVFGGS